MGAVATKKAESPAKMEAAKSLLNLYKSASNYYTAPRVAMGTGLKIECQFPENQDWTPAGSPCDGEGHQFEVNTMLWTTMTWSALNFQMNDRHHAAYKVESTGTLAGAKAKLMARTDVNCDGKWEVTTRMIEGDPSTTHAECSVKPTTR